MASTRVAPPVRFTEARVVQPVQEQVAETTQGENGTATNGANAEGAYERARARRRSQQDAVLDAVDAASGSSQLVVLYVYTNSDERKYRSAREASANFARAIIGNFQVATELQGCVCIRVELSDLSRDVRRKYGISNGAPQLMAFDAKGKKLFRVTRSNNAPAVAQMLKSAKEHNIKVVARMDG